MDTLGVFNPPAADKFDLVSQIKRELVDVRAKTEELLTYCPGNCKKANPSKDLLVLIDKAIKLETILKAEIKDSRQVIIDSKGNVGVCEVKILPCGAEVFYCHVLDKPVAYVAPSLEEAKALLTQMA